MRQGGLCRCNLRLCPTQSIRRVCAGAEAVPPHSRAGIRELHVPTGTMCVHGPHAWRAYLDPRAWATQWKALGWSAAARALRSW